MRHKTFGLTRYRRAKLGRVGSVKRSVKQTGKTHTRIDKKRSALPPGKRISRRGRAYWETRRNRSDKSKRTRL